MKVKQYCRCCANCVYGDAIWCSEKRKVMAESTAKKANTCKMFVFNPIDALGGDLNKLYKPRQEKPKDTSPTLFDEENKCTDMSKKK